MSTHKNMDRICVAAMVVALVLMIVLANAETMGIQAADKVMGYEGRLFDTSSVHTIDIIMDDWETFLTTAQSEEYTACSVVIDGEAFQNVGIRGKGNTSLSTVSSMDSNRYSFKIEFDQYDAGKSYYGLDKLSLNNLIQDTTYMKDYLTYRMMNEFGAAAPLCSYVYITVNGEDWGLYLAVEGVEEAFLQRNYGSNYGELYKPDSMNFGGGRGNGRDFSMEDFMAPADEDSAFEKRQEAGRPAMPDMGEHGGMNDGMGSSDVKLQYVDDDPASYSTIFESAKTDITDADQLRLIESLKLLSSGDAEQALDMDAVLRYFVVHNYVVNGDSYTGSMVHNYYLYEENGKLAMIPWDYNLAYGTFQGNQANSAVHDDIDSPLSVTGSGDRPMVDWIFENSEYTELYHQYFAEFLETVEITAIIDEAAERIAPYVEKDPTAFYSYEEFENGVETLREFCQLRSQSVQNQLDGSGEMVDASHLNLSDMGTMNMGGSFGDRGDRTRPEKNGAPELPPAERTGQTDSGAPMPQMPGGISGEIPQNRNGAFPGMPDDAAVQSGDTLPLLAISAAVLAAGLIFAFAYRRRR